MKNLKNTVILERLDIKRNVGVLIHSAGPIKLSQLTDSLLPAFPVHGALSLDSAVCLAALAALEH